MLDELVMMVLICLNRCLNGMFGSIYVKGSKYLNKIWEKSTYKASLEEYLVDLPLLC
jgi:hypothetical protein